MIFSLLHYLFFPDQLIFLKRKIHMWMYMNYSFIFYYFIIIFWQLTWHLYFSTYSQTCFFHVCSCHFSEEAWSRRNAMVSLTKIQIHSVTALITNQWAINVHSACKTNSKKKCLQKYSKYYRKWLLKNRLFEYASFLKHFQWLCNSSWEETEK